MAITKTVFSSTAATNQAQVLAWLQNNAAELFDNIASADNTITCSINSKTFMSITFSGTGVQDRINLYLANGEHTAFRTLLPSYGVATSHGILLHFAEYSTSYRATDIIIGKTNDNDIGWAVAGQQHNGTTMYQQFYAIDFDKSPNIIAYYTNSASQGNVLTPIANTLSTNATMTTFAYVPSYGTESYLADVYQLPYNQYNGTSGVITTEGKNYFTTGALALAD